MKKTISIHLMGINFLVEEDAYDLVRDYLDRLKESLKFSNDRKEICEDVELRIAELASAYLSDKKQVISLEDMRQILDTLGQPEEYVDEESTDQSRSAYESGRTTGSDRRFFRDRENAMLSGVCAGLAAYFNIDVAIIRVIFVLLGLFGGFAIPLYIILWVVIPPARTNIERLRMQGRPVTVETLKEEFEDAAQRLRKSGSNFQREIRDTGSPVRQKLGLVGTLIGKIIGTGLLFFGTILLIMLLIGSFVDFQFFPFDDSDNPLTPNQVAELVMADSANYTYIWLGGLLVGLSVVMFMFLLGSTLLFKLRTKWLKPTYLVLLGVFIGGVVLCIYQGIRIGKEYTISGEFEKNAGQVTDSVLYARISAPRETDFVHSDDDFDFDGEPIEISGGNIYESGIPVHYDLSEDSSFHIYVEYSALGRNRKEAISRSHNIDHGVLVSGNTVTISPFYRFPQKDKIRNQSVRLTIQIPEGKKVVFGKNTVTSADTDDSGYITKDGEYEHRIDESDVF